MLDSACSSGLYALEHAYRAIRDGYCDSAIVGASNLLLHPYLTLLFSRLGVLSRGGNCRPFDRDGMYLSTIQCYIFTVLFH
jgi:fatty acid synthase